MALKSKKNIPQERSRKVTNLLLSTVLSCGVLSFFAFVVFIHDMPDLDNLETHSRKASIVFKSYDGKTIATYGDLFRSVVTVDRLPNYIADAVVAVEDHRFYHHHGVDLWGIIRAAVVNLMHRRVVQGGSTLTQQLAKNLFLSRSKSVKRKIQEFVLALWLEKRYSKRQILSIYLNRVYFGSGAYGIDAAAYKFFGKNAKELTLYETAKLVGTLKSPIKYSPFYNPEESDERAKLVITKMYEEKLISQAEMQDALQEKSKPKLLPPIDENKYFTDWAFEQMQNLVSVDSEDLIVRTTLDSRLQVNAACIVRESLKNFGFKNGASQIALVALDKTGAVRAMIGGHTYSASQYNRALAVRSFGSSFKLFVFISALENGMDIYDTVSDSPIHIGKWSPKNYKYQSVGSVSLLDAFVKSINTCAVRLTQKVGIDAVISKAQQMGITSDLSRNYASVLGASGVNLLEMTSCYGTIMVDGEKMTPFGIISIKNKKGKELYRASSSRRPRVVAPKICEKMKIMMRETVNRGTGKRAKLPINAYGKTGTSNGSRDANFIGFAPPLVVGVWVGNDDNNPMSNDLTGGTLPAMVWRDFMLTALGYERSKSNEDLNDSKIRTRKRLKSLITRLANSQKS